MPTRVLEQTDLLAAIRLAHPEIEPLMRRGIFADEDTGRSYFTGYDYKTLYDWDQYFEAIVQLYMGWSPELARNGITIFLDHQQPSGMISRSVPSNEFHDPEHVKPFLAQTAVLLRDYWGDAAWLTTAANDGRPYWDKLKAYLDYWLQEMDSTGDGLAEWMSAPHTGMDNQHERAGWWNDRICKGVDLNAFLVRECEAMASLASTVGDAPAAVRFAEEARAMAARVRERMWDERDGIFHDRHAKTGAPIRVRYINVFATLWAGIATPKQARRMIFDYLMNPDEFWSPYPPAVLARSEPGYSQTKLPEDLGCSWRANTWIPSNYIVFHGLRRYGYGELASLVAHVTTKLMEKSGNREYYNSETGEGCGLDPFWGWSLLGHFIGYEDQCQRAVCALETP